MEGRDKGWKEIRDAVHGQIELHPLCVSIMDTPEFQRLRNISQCGLTHLVYPSACHSRFEHSLGVYHLAGLMLKKIEDTGQKINESDKLSVQIAALCHDLGHGPFSHTWERFVHLTGSEFKHEEMSVKLLRYLIKENDLAATFDKYGVKVEHIGRLILGKPKDDSEDPDKRYLYEIVANNATGVDVDKWDYMLRDALHFGVKTELNYERILSSVSIVECNDMMHVAFRDKVASNIIEMFEVREKLHRICYQHRVSKIIEIMLIDALVLVNTNYRVKLKNEEFKLSESHTNLEAYIKLSDYLYYELLNSIDENLNEGKQIIERIVRRKLYTLVDCHALNLSQEDNNNFKDDVFEEYAKAEMTRKFPKHTFRISFIDLSADMNKIENIFCFDKNSKVIKFPGKMRACEKEAMLICTSYKIEPDTLKEMKDAYLEILKNCSSKIVS